MKKNFTIILPRHTEDTLAIVKCQSELDKNNEVMEAIRSAVTKWIKKTKEGKKAWEESCQDFNIADLALYDYDKKGTTLRRYLNESGIFCLEIEIGNNGSDFVFDTILYNGD